MFAGAVAGALAGGWAGAEVRPPPVRALVGEPVGEPVGLPLALPPSFGSFRGAGSGMSAIGMVCLGVPRRASFMASRQIGPGPSAPKTSLRYLPLMLMLRISTPPLGPPIQTEVASCGV